MLEALISAAKIGSNRKKWLKASLSCHFTFNEKGEHLFVSAAKAVVSCREDQHRGRRV